MRRSAMKGFPPDNTVVTLMTSAVMATRSAFQAEIGQHSRQL